MSKKKKPGLTRRQDNLFHQILAGHDTEMWWRHHRKDGVAWSAAVFAIRFKGRDIDVKRIQRIVIQSEDPEIVYYFAKHPDANVRRLTEVMIKFGNAEQMRTFARHVPGVNKKLLEDWASIYETFFG